VHQSVSGEFTIKRPKPKNERRSQWWVKRIWKGGKRRRKYCGRWDHQNLDKASQRKPQQPKGERMDRWKGGKRCVPRTPKKIRLKGTVTINPHLRRRVGVRSTVEGEKRVKREASSNPTIVAQMVRDLNQRENKGGPLHREKINVEGTGNHGGCSHRREGEVRFRINKIGGRKKKPGPVGRQKGEGDDRAPKGGQQRELGLGGTR